MHNKSINKEKMLKIAIIISGVTAVLLMVFGSFKWNPDRLLFFTAQSNLWAVIIAALFLKERTHAFFKVARFMVTSSVMVTLLVFNLILTPQLIIVGNYGYLFSLNNLFAHYLTPILLIADYILYAKKEAKSIIYYALVLPLIYFIFAMVANPLFGIKFDNHIVPYFFLNYKEYTFFNIGYAATGVYGNMLKLGVFYWVIIVLGIVLSIGVLLYYLKSRQKPCEKMVNP